MPISNYAANLALTADPTRLRSDLTKAKMAWKGFGDTVNKQFGGAAKTAGVGIAALGVGLAAATKEAANFADALGKGARAAGLSSDSFQAITQAIERMGGSAMGTEKIFARIAVALQGIENTTQIKIFDSLGLSLERLQTLDIDEVFNEILVALSKIPDEATRNARAIELFGAKGAKSVLLLADSIEVYKTEVEGAAQFAIVGAEQIAAAETFNDAIDDITKAIKVGFANAVLDFGIERNRDWFESMQGVSEGISNLTEGIVDISLFLAEHRALITGIATAWVAFKAVLFTQAAATAIVATAVALKGLSVSLIALSANPVILGLAAVAASVAAIGYAVEVFTEDDSGDGLITRFFSGAVEEAKAFAASLSDAAAESVNLADTFERSDDNLEVLTIRITESAIPAVEDLNISIEDTSESTNLVRTAMGLLARSEKEALQETVGLRLGINDTRIAITSAADSFADAADHLQDGVGAIQEAVDPALFDEFADAAGSASVSFRDALSDALAGTGNFSDIGKRVIQGVRRSIADSIADNITTKFFQPLATRFSTSLLGAFDRTSKGWFNGIIDLLSTGFGGLGKGLITALDNLVDGLGTGFGNILGSFASSISDTFEGLGSVIGLAVTGYSLLKEFTGSNEREKTRADRVRQLDYRLAQGGINPLDSPLYADYRAYQRRYIKKGRTRRYNALIDNYIKKFYQEAGLPFPQDDYPYLHEGGIVPGRRGEDVVAILQAGERVLPLEENDRGQPFMQVDYPLRVEDVLESLGALFDQVSERIGPDFAEYFSNILIPTLNTFDELAGASNYLTEVLAITGDTIDQSELQQVLEAWTDYVSDGKGEPFEQVEERNDMVVNITQNVTGDVDAATLNTLRTHAREITTLIQGELLVTT